MPKEKTPVPCGTEFHWSPQPGLTVTSLTRRRSTLSYVGIVAGTDLNCNLRVMSPTSYRCSRDNIYGGEGRIRTFEGCAGSYNLLL